MTVMFKKSHIAIALLALNELRGIFVVVGLLRWFHS